MIIVEGTIRVNDLTLARAAMRDMIEASRAEDGCISYSYAVDILEPDLVHVSERWESREALAAHTKTAHIAAWRAQWPAVGISDRSLRLYEAEPEAF